MSLKTLYAKAVALVTKAGHTTTGKAVEHAVVAGVAVGVSLLVKDLATGSLSLNDTTAAAVAAGSAILAGLRAALKAQTSSAASFVQGEVEKASLATEAPQSTAPAPTVTAPPAVFSAEQPPNPLS